MDQDVQSGHYVMRRCPCCGETFVAIKRAGNPSSYCATCRRNATAEYLRDRARTRRNAFFAARDKLATQPVKVVVVIRDGVLIERRGTVPIGGRAANFNTKAQ